MRKISTWKDSFIFKVYEMAKSGMSERAMSRALNISIHTYHKYFHRRPLFKMAVQRGRKMGKNKQNGQYSLRNYVYDRLPGYLKEIWDKINRLDTVENGYEVIEALLEKSGKLARQHLFLYAWVDGGFSVSAACRKVCISRAVFDLWCKTDADFLALAEDINWHKKNFFEDALIGLVADKDSSAVIFANKTYNRDRGYGEKLVVEQNIKSAISICDLNLTLDEKKQLLMKYRQKQLSTNPMNNMNMGNIIEGKVTNVG